MRRVLVAGGAGYIGSHTSVCLIQAGYSVTIADNFVNSSVESIARVRELTGASESVLNAVNVDLCDAALLDRVFVEHGPFVACIHFAGLKAVGESVLKPLLYYENNLLSTTNLLSALDKHGCTAFVFSSSATVYGSAPVYYLFSFNAFYLLLFLLFSKVPISESSLVGVGITNPYGRTKYMIEEILKVSHVFLSFLRLNRKMRVMRISLSRKS
jgi:UDP-glucose 4-epimerase